QGTVGPCSPAVEGIILCNSAGKAPSGAELLEMEPAHHGSRRSDSSGFTGTISQGTRILRSPAESVALHVDGACVIKPRRDLLELLRPTPRGGRAHVLCGRQNTAVSDLAVVVPAPAPGVVLAVETTTMQTTGRDTDQRVGVAIGQGLHDRQRGKPRGP